MSMQSRLFEIKLNIMINLVFNSIACCAPSSFALA